MTAGDDKRSPCAETVPGAERDRLVAAATAYLDHRSKFGHQPATDEPNPTFNEFMVALIRVCPDGWSGAGAVARLIVTAAGVGAAQSDGYPATGGAS